MSNYNNVPTFNTPTTVTTPIFPFVVPIYPDQFKDPSTRENELHGDSCYRYNKVMGLYSDLKNMLQNTAKSCDSFKATPPKFVECMSKKLPVITSQAVLTSSYYNKIVLPEKNRSPSCFGWT